MVTQGICEPSEVHFTSRQTPLAHEYERVFGARVRFRQAVNRLVYPRRLMMFQAPICRS
jgi:hypothetical protein